MGRPVVETQASVAKADELTLRRLHRRIEDLAPRLRLDAFSQHDPEALVNLQESILRLQIDVQTEIARVKRRRPRSASSYLYTEELRRTRSMTRVLGDSLAWTILLLDRQLIHALRRNEPVPVPPRLTDSHVATLEFARRNMSPEWGIPIVHDITDVLRIGDITFMRPTGAQVPLADYRTYELKVSRIGEDSTDESGRRRVEVRVTAIANEPFPDVPAHLRGAREDAPSSAERPAGESSPRTDRRIERQLSRMDEARDRKHAALHQFTEVGDDRIFTVQIEDEPEPEWSRLRRAIRSARRDGYAFFSLGGFVGYALFYSAERVTLDDATGTRFGEDVRRSLLHANLGARNSLTVMAVPAVRDNNYSGLATPMFLWDLPRNAIRDLIRGRLSITAVFNAGRMEELLREAGMEVNPSTVENDRRDFEVVVPLAWENARGEYHTGGPWEEMTIATQEFRHPSAVVKRVQAVAVMPNHVSADEVVGDLDSGGGISRASS